MENSKPKLRRPLKFILRLNKKERADLDQLAAVLMRSKNEAICIAIVYLAQEIEKHGGVSNLIFASTSSLPDLRSGKRKAYGN